MGGPVKKTTLYLQGPKSTNKDPFKDCCGVGTTRYSSLWRFWYEPKYLARYKFREVPRKTGAHIHRTDHSQTKHIPPFCSVHLNVFYLGIPCQLSQWSATMVTKDSLVSWINGSQPGSWQILRPIKVLKVVLQRKVQTFRNNWEFTSVEGWRMAVCFTTSRFSWGT